MTMIDLNRMGLNMDKSIMSPPKFPSSHGHVFGKGDVSDARLIQSLIRKMATSSSTAEKCPRRLASLRAWTHASCQRWLTKPHVVLG